MINRLAEQLVLEQTVRIDRAEELLTEWKDSDQQEEQGK